MAQLATEGLPDMGIEFSRRRGYTATEIAEHETLMDILRCALAAGANEDELASAEAMLQGVLDPFELSEAPSPGA